MGRPTSISSHKGELFGPSQGQLDGQRRMSFMIELPNGWTLRSSRPLVDGSVVVMAERVQAVDLSAQKRNLFDQYATFRLGPDGIVAGPIRWLRADAEADYNEALR